jgi:hypothetical protein
MHCQTPEKTAIIALLAEADAALQEARDVTATTQANVLARLRVRLSRLHAALQDLVVDGADSSQMASVIAALMGAVARIDSAETQPSLFSAWCELL